MTRLLIGSRAFVLVAATLLVSHVAIGLWTGQFIISHDGSEYIRMAENMLGGRGFSYDGVNPVVGKPPGLPAVTVVFLYVFGSLTGFHLLQILFLFGSYFSIARLSGVAFGDNAAMLTLALFVAIDPLRDLATNVLTEPLFLLLLGSGMLALYLSLRSRSSAQAIGAGMLFGLATYVRPISLFWPLAVLMLCWFWDRRRVRLALTVIVVHLIVIGPWIVRNAIQFSRVVPVVSNWGPMYVMSNGELWEKFQKSGWGAIFEDSTVRSLIGSEFTYNWMPQERLRAATLAGIRSDLKGWIRRCVIQSTRAWTYVPGTRAWEWQRPTLYWLGRGAMLGFYLACFLGSVFYLKRDADLNTILLGHALYSGLMLFPVTVESRYLIPVYFCLMPLAVNGVLNLFRRFTGSLGNTQNPTRL